MTTNKMKFFRASLLHFIDDPYKGLKASYQYFQDGLLVIEDGHVLEVGAYKKLKSKYRVTALNNYTGKLIIPGFIDTHVHYPQIEMVASFGEQLLEWLNNYTFPTEEKFSDIKYARKVSKIFLDKLLKNGTTTALVFPTVHPESVDAFFKESKKRNLRMISGKVLMDRNAPKKLRDTPKKGYEQSKKLIQKWHKNGRLLYAVTPRFAITSSDQQLELAGKLLKEFPDVYMQTHLAENHSEIDFVKELFPQCHSYLDVYDKFNLTGRNSIFAHSIHLESKDFKTLKKTASNVSYCPTSNLFLGSGFFKLSQMQKHGINVGMGTDLGAGTSFSMLQTLNEAYKVINIQKSLTKNKEKLKAIKPLDPFQALYLATLGGARTLNLEGKIGNFTKGTEADFIVLDHSYDEYMSFRMKQTKNLAEKLFAIMMLGNEKMIFKTYIMGSEYEK